MGNSHEVAQPETRHLRDSVRIQDSRDASVVGNVVLFGMFRF